MDFATYVERECCKWAPAGAHFAYIYSAGPAKPSDPGNAIPENPGWLTVALNLMGSAFHHLEIMRDLGGFAEHDAGRAVFVSRQMYRLFDPFGVERLAGDGEMDMDLGVRS